LAGGGWNLRPVPDFHNMPRRRKQFMAQVARSPGKSIYELAKALGMQYRRAHEHAQTLTKEGKLRARESVENGHRKRKLFPAYGPL
jgi:predicted ArsR family transcriptional regulator